MSGEGFTITAQVLGIDNVTVIYMGAGIWLSAELIHGLHRHDWDDVITEGSAPRPDHMELGSVARDVLGYFGVEGGWSPGGFTSKLISAVESADNNNAGLLREVYPFLVDAISLFRSSGGIAILQERAKW